MDPTVISVSSSSIHEVSKHPRTSINLLRGLGVEGDAHLGKTTQHLYLLKKDPTRTNLRQVHLLHAELHDLLRDKLFDISPGLMGENVTTRGIDLMALPRGTRLQLGQSAIIEVTGFREPCSQLNRLRPGLIKAVFMRNPQKRLVPNAGIMAIVIEAGQVDPGDAIHIELPVEPHDQLGPI